MKTQTNEYHYAIDAAQLILKCRKKLRLIIHTNPQILNISKASDSFDIESEPGATTIADGVNPNVLDLDRTLLSVEQLIHYHLLNLVEHAKERSEYINARDHFVDIHQDTCSVAARPPQFLNQVHLSTVTTLSDSVQELLILSNVKHNHEQDSSPSSMMTPLIVDGKRRRSQSYPLQTSSKSSHVGREESSSLLPQLSPSSSFSNSSFQEKSAIDSLLFRLIVILQLCLVRIEEAKSILHNRSKLPWIIMSTAAFSALTSSSYNLQSRYKKVCKNLVRLGAVGTCMIIRKGWMKLCLNTRLLNTSLTLEDWQQQWILIQSIGLGDKGTALQDEQCRHLLTLIPSKKTYGIWGSESSFRYNLIKWVMDCAYASVGTALSKNESRSVWMPLTAAAAASYYAVVGPSWKSAEVLSTASGPGSSDLMQNTWGMVSLPVVKTISLQASRLLKGAAIAERIEICGVSCFILSKDPCPALSTAMRRYHRQQSRDRDSPHLGTILEEQIPSRTVNLREYPRKNVIFHLTGGGFFAHTLAGDIPFLMDWSGVTNSIVIAIEYALLPDHKFPDALEEITKVFRSIMDGTVFAPLVGVQIDRVIVTGESTGGNLATALCIKLCMDDRRQKEEGGCEDQGGNRKFHQDLLRKPLKLPDALLLCCPALNLSLELSPSRVITHDAVLPSALISTISNEYLGDNSKMDPLASPIFAPDTILSIFPPTLMYVSAQDPFLDDSVVFNKRLKRLGVECDLRAAQNLPHAYWGLGTAGFPEAKKVLRECESWMTKQFERK